MKLYHIALLIIKIFISVQLVLIFLKLESPNHRVFVITDAIFNFYVGAFIIAYFLFPTKNATIDFHDRMFVILGGFLLIYNIDFQSVWKAVEGK
jgi:hypothetical protein